MKLVITYTYSDGRRGFSLALDKSIMPKLDVGLGYRPNPPWDASFLTSPEHKLTPWRRISYINDPITHFQKWIQYDNNDKKKMMKIDRSSLIPGIAFFSSQCDPNMASARLDQLKPLIEALKAYNIRFASFGKCFHTEDMEVSMPQCTNLRRYTCIFVICIYV
jgi:hypothetical protein